MSTPTLVAGVLWLVALWRLPSLRHSRKQRSLALALATLAAAVSFEVPQVKEAVDAAFGTNARLSPLLKHLHSALPRRHICLTSSSQSFDRRAWPVAPGWWPLA
ncbi:hypothetical protein [Streptomyces malaysiensis]|uniref:hypothetical protein n=1 Tax=Streptomyces malaysiensis TaxID=92644 RepID=UPI001FCD505C|nr:hypothetical protein [Streptomyces malaysiensis]